ncbi:4-fold beta flower protein [Aeromonas jandaei]|uniref:4-fold beta flower protein n=1 Tax=Aeromonas jandaei TaxID=650 RepID=UPI0039868554
MAIDFYSKSGSPIAYTEDGQHIYLFSGAPVAHLDGDAVYSFSGNHIGWFEDGWVRDLKGKCVFYTASATGGPVKPVKKVKPVKSVKRVKPIKGVKKVKSVKAIKSLSWSPLSSEQFFA